MTVRIRRMAADDAVAVSDVVWAASEDELRRAGNEPPTKTREQREQFERGMRRFVDDDGDGAWVAETDDGIVGMAEAIRRDSFWGLSMLFVHPKTQSQGIGRRLLDRTLEYAEGAEVRMIMTSEDPRALRRYSALGLAIHPAVKAEGAVERSTIPAGLPGDEVGAEALDLVDAVDGKLLARSRMSDVEFMLANGGRLYVVDHAGRRGFVVTRRGNPAMLGADDVETATALLWRAFADAGDETEMYCLTATQDWAVKVALAARLKVTPGGPLFVDGMDALPAPWIPSGWYF